MCIHMATKSRLISPNSQLGIIEGQEFMCGRLPIAINDTNPTRITTKQSTLHGYLKIEPQLFLSTEGKEITKKTFNLFVLSVYSVVRLRLKIFGPITQKKVGFKSPMVNRVLENNLRK